MTTTVYGSSDDLIEVEGDVDEEFSALGDDAPSLLAFSDGTVLRIAYTDSGVWRITPVLLSLTSPPLRIEQAPEDDEDSYTDRAHLDGGIRWVVLGTELAKAR